MHSSYCDGVNQIFFLPCINEHGGLNMSLIEYSCILEGVKGQKMVTALFDSGASFSCIKMSVAEKLAHLERLAKPMEFETADKNTTISAHYGVILDFYLGESQRRFHDDFIVLDSLSEDLIIGAATMQKWNIKLDFQEETVIYDRKMHRLRI
jgi:hypothetical protein